MAITKEALQEHDEYNQRALLAIFARYGVPQTMLDIGSGSGIMTQTARKLGVKAIGLDLLAEPPDIKHDFETGSLFIGHKVDFILSIETAEHIANEEAFIETVRAHTKEGTIFVLTAAVPGQLGDGHVNCQPKSHWRQIFTEMGYNYRSADTALLADWWRYAAGGLSAWLSPNLQVFRYE